MYVAVRRMREGARGGEMMSSRRGQADKSNRAREAAGTITAAAAAAACQHMVIERDEEGRRVDRRKGGDGVGPPLGSTASWCCCVCGGAPATRRLLARRRSAFMQHKSKSAYTEGTQGIGGKGRSNDHLPRRGVATEERSYCQGADH